MYFLCLFLFQAGPFFCHILASVDYVSELVQLPSPSAAYHLGSSQFRWMLSGRRLAAISDTLSIASVRTIRPVTEIMAGILAQITSQTHRPQSGLTDHDSDSDSYCCHPVTAFIRANRPVLTTIKADILAAIVGQTHRH